MLIWLVLLCLLVNRASSWSNTESELAELNNLLIESLRVNPLLLDDKKLSEDSKRFITVKLDSFVHLVSQSQIAAFSRTKRSLEHVDKGMKKNSINIFPENVIPVQNVDDIRLFQSINNTLAVSLENRNRVALYRYSNSIFKDIFQIPFEYKTNVAVASTAENLSLIIVGNNEFVTIFQLHLKNQSLERLQNIKVSASKHVAAWEQGQSVYLSITETLDNSHNHTSTVKIFQWLGRHFDNIQDIQLNDIKKTVPFTIHGSDFLAAVNSGQHKGEKTYSEIYKFNPHTMKFKTYQLLLTNGCTDMKYFTAKIHGNYHHFLVVVHANSLKDSSRETAISVIYKYDDDYFIPFQSIETRAATWQPIQDFEGNSALIAVTPDGLQGFQFDGWNFFESQLETDIEDIADLKIENVKALHTFDFDGKEKLVLACIYCSNSVSMYSVNFTQLSTLKDAHSDLLDWCTSTLKEFALSDDDPPFLRETLRGDLNEEISVDEDQKQHMAAALTQSNEVLYSIEDTIKSLILDAEVLEADTIIFNNHTQVDEVYASSINGIDIDRLFNNTINIVDGFNVNGSMEFNVLVAQNKLSFSTLNGIPLEDYVLSNKDMVLDNLTVHGSVTFESGLHIESNMLGDVKITENNLLLKTGDQAFEGDLTVDELLVNDLTAKHLNCFNLESVEDHRSEQTTHIENMKVKNLEIGGLLNNVNMPVLAKRALKKSGDQIWEQQLSFDSLEVQEVNVKQGLSGKMIPSDFVRTDSGEYHIDQDVTFTKDLHANKLEVSESLNNISVNKNNVLDVLLIDAPEHQEIPARKTFKNLIVSNLIHRPNNTKQYEISGDLVIKGNVEVTQQLKVRDLRSVNGSGSIADVFTNGVKLMDSEMPIHLTFTQPLNIDNAITHKVNLLDPHKWLLETSDSPQIISGHKEFLGDINLGGRIHVSQLNNIDIQALESEVLMVHGDQEINGFWSVDSVVALKGVISNKTDLKLDGRTSIPPNLIVQTNLEAKLNTTGLEVKGLINSSKIQDILGNMVKKNAEFVVFGEKNFKQLHVKDLLIHEGHSNIPNLLRNITCGEITIDTNMDLFNNISISSLTFNGSLNNLSRANFDGLMHLDSNPDDTVVISSDMQFDELVVLGDVFIKDNYINGKNLTAIETDTVKIDEDHEFPNGLFDETITVKDTLYLNGNFENLDLDFIVLQESTNLIKIYDKIFKDALFVNGTLSVDSTVNGMDLHKFCTFSEPSDTLKTLKIRGDVVFAKGPNVLHFNNLNVKNLKKTLWFTDREAHISGNVNLRNVTFNEPLLVQNFVDGSDVSLLAKHYLSKSKDQVIPASFTFSNVTFSNISTAIVKTNSTINGIFIDDILNNLLLQEEAQIFEAPAYFEEVHIKNLSGTFTVNDLNLETEVMRYDSQNIVTGRKVFNNLNVGALNLPHNVKIQNVDVLDWLNNTVLNNGTFRITGRKIFNNATFKQGLSLRGHLNNHTFNENTIMLLDKPQSIIGRKVFLNVHQQPMLFKTVRVKGSVNDINLQELVRSQTNKHHNTTFKSEIVFDNDLEVNDINVDVLYNHLNVSQLISNVTTLCSLEHFQQKFRNLLDMGMAVEKSLKGQATIFKYFKEVIKFDNVYEIFGLRCADGIFRVVAFTFENGTNSFRTFEWESKSGTFVLMGENTLESYSKPSFMKQLSIGNMDYVFMEHLSHYGSQNNKYICSGYLMELKSPSNFEKTVEFQRSATASLAHFQDALYNRTCLAFIGHTLSGLDIYCYEDQHSYYWTQRISMPGIYKAVAVETESSVYLFLARHGYDLSREPSIVVFQSDTKFPNFEQIQTIYEGVDLNGLTAATINDIPYVAFSFGSQESAIESGRVSVRRLDVSSNQFIPWQHISVAAPLDVQFVTKTSFEPLLLIPTADPNGPLHTMSYNGVARFKRVLQGSSLPISTKVRTVGNGHFVVTLQGSKKTGTILEAVVKGSLKT